MNIKVLMISGTSLLALIIGDMLFMKFVILGTLQNNSNNKEEKTESLSYNTGPGNSSSSATHIITLV